MIEFCKEFDLNATIRDTGDLLVLFQKLNYLANNWLPYLPGVEKRLSIDSFVEKHVLSWIDEMDANLYKWTLNSQIVDDFKPIGPEVLHSNSVVDLFTATGFAFEYLKPILTQWTQASVYSFLDRFIESVNKSAFKFCERIARDIASTVVPFLGVATSTSASASIGAVSATVSPDTVSSFFSSLFAKKQQQQQEAVLNSPAAGRAQQKFNITPEVSVASLSA